MRSWSVSSIRSFHGCQLAWYFRRTDVKPEFQPLALVEGTVLHAARAVTLMGNKEWRLARADIDRARVGELPEHVGRALDELARECDLRLEARRSK